MGKPIKEINLQTNPRIVNASENDQIFIKMEIGNYHAGSCLVNVDGVHVGSGYTVLQPLGDAKALQNSKIRTLATITDFSPANDKAVLTTQFLNQDNVRLFFYRLGIVS